MTTGSRSSSPLLVALVICSLLLNVTALAIIFVMIVAGRQTAASMADHLEALGQQTIQYQFHINQTVPIHTSVPFRYSVKVPYEEAMPISTTVSVNKELPVIGVIGFDVPIRTIVPISLSIPVEISQTVPVNAEVPLDLEIPLEIRVQDTPLQSALDDMVKTLRFISAK